MLRGDPDQILIGEIRDKETAQLAIQAALTGHLVYSTLHTNTAIGSISRLINFGIEPFLLAPTLLLVIGQRMTRRLAGAGREVPVSNRMRSYLDTTFSDLPQRYRSQLPDFTSFRDPEPTDEYPTGMSGRVGVFEVLEIDDEVRSLIMEKSGESDITRAARKNGFITMSESALIKGSKGIIPFSEAMKVNNEDSIETDVQSSDVSESFDPDTG